MSQLALYRYFSDGGQLLYVGITNDPHRRMSQHEAKTWWSQVRGMTIDWYPDRASVLAAEKRAITVENPLYNVQHKPDVKPRRSINNDNAPLTAGGVAREVLAELPEEETTAALAQARDDYPGEDEEVIQTHAALSAVHNVWHDRVVLANALKSLLKSREDYREILFRAHSDVATYMGPTYTETDLLSLAAFLATKEGDHR